MRLQIKVTHKLLHNSRETDKHPPVFLGTIKATFHPRGTCRISLINPSLDPEALCKVGIAATPGMADYHQRLYVNPIIRERIKTYDPRYPIVWSEDNCIETEIKELN